MIGLGLIGTALSARLIDARIPVIGVDVDPVGRKIIARDFVPQSHIAQTLRDAELILDEGERCGQALPMTSVQADLLRKTIARLGDACDSAAIIEAIRPSKGKSGAAS